MNLEKLSRNGYFVKGAQTEKTERKEEILERGSD